MPRDTALAAEFQQLCALSWEDHDEWSLLRLAQLVCLGVGPQEEIPDVKVRRTLAEAPMSVQWDPVAIQKSQQLCAEIRAHKPEPLPPEFIARACAGNPEPEGGIGGTGAMEHGKNVEQMSADDLRNPEVYAEVKAMADRHEINVWSERYHAVQDAMVEHGDLSAATVRQWRATQQGALWSVFPGIAAKHERRWHDESRSLRRAELVCVKSRRATAWSPRASAREPAPRRSQRRAEPRESRAGPGSDSDPDEPSGPLERLASYGGPCRWFAVTRRHLSPAEQAIEELPPSLEAALWRTIGKAVERARADV